MLIKDLTGKKHNINLGTALINSGNHANRSSYHLKARELLHNTFSSVQILEEVPIPINKGQTVYFDFFIPLLGIFVEIHGSQHYIQSDFFHKNNTDFLNQKKRDQDKRIFCEINNFTLIELKFDEEDKWEEQLKG